MLMYIWYYNRWYVLMNGVILKYFFFKLLKIVYWVSWIGGVLL